MTLTVGSLFSGIGGFDLGLERAGMRVIWQSEIDPYASAVLRKHWPEVPNHGDIRSIRAGTVERPDLICGGFPCQPFSHAGQRGGTGDDRHLWPEMCRVIDELRPAWVIGENVAGIISMELDAVLSDLEALGYATRTFVVPAVAVDAPHRRDRVWIVGHAADSGYRSVRNSDGGQRQFVGASDDTRQTDADSNLRHVKQKDAIRAGRSTAISICDRDRDRESTCAVDAKAQGLSGTVADADKPRSQGRIGGIVRERACQWAIGARSASAGQPARWLPEPDVGRVANGIPRRVDRLRCLGNAIVPQVAEVIGRAIVSADAIRGVEPGCASPA